MPRPIPLPVITNLNIKGKNGVKFIQASYPERPNGGWSRNKIAKVSKALGEKYGRRKSGAVQVCINDGTKWRSGKFTTFGAPVVLYSAADSDGGANPPSYERFNVYIRIDGNNAGGVTKDNSCLYDSLSFLIPKEDLPWISDVEFKTYLKLSPKAMVPITLMDQVQEKLPKYKLMVTGDFMYTSSVRSHHEVKIILEDNHYSPKQLPKRVFGVAFEEKMPLIYQMNHAKGFYWAMHSNIPKRRRMTKEEFQGHYSKPRTSEYILIPYDEELGTFKENLEAFISKANIYKEKSAGVINLYKTGTNTKTILHLFENYTKNIDSEIIEQDEATWISKATKGSLIYAQQYKGEGHEYDIVSMYPSIQQNNKMLFPIKRGDFQFITKEVFNAKTFYQYGIYRCTVEYSKEKEKLFRWNDEGYYTHFDLNLANKLGLSITIHPTGPNALIYERAKLIQGHELFKKYIDVLFPFKQAGVPDAKKLINSLWGALCQKDEITKNMSLTEDFELYGGREVTEIQPRGNPNQLRVRYVNTQQTFKTTFARIGPFLLSRARLMMGDMLLPHYKNIVRIHTDGFISTEKLNITTGTELGQLKYGGGYKRVTVEHANSYKLKQRI